MNVRDVWHYPGRRFPGKVRCEHSSSRDRSTATLVAVRSVIVQSRHHLCLRNFRRRRMDFVGLRGLGHHCNHRFNGGASRFMALQLADRNRDICRQSQRLVDPAFNLLNRGGIRGGTRLFEEVHRLEQKRQDSKE